MDFCESEIEKFFSGKTVFVTGATGFLGRILIEKLLREIPKINKVYILIRPKKGKNAEERFREYFENELYSVLRQNTEVATIFKKVNIIEGDCEKPNLGIDENGRNIIISEVNCIFHLAATVRFNEPLKKTTSIHINATKDLVCLAKQISNLSCFVHVSTAFSFCTHRTIDEVVYETEIKTKDLDVIVSNLGDRCLSSIETIIKGDWPNTYTFTKALAETIINEASQDIPVAICRPGIVLPTYKDPVVGWINSIFGPTGLFMGINLGFIRVLQGVQSYNTELVPADYVINQIIAVAWKLGTQRDPNKKLPVYNYISSCDNPITWKKCHEIAYKYSGKIFSVRRVWYTYLVTASNSVVVAILSFLLHTIPAYAVDFFAGLAGMKPPLLAKMYKKIDDNLKYFTYFGLREWTFKNENVRVLWNEMNETDKRKYPFDVKQINWEEYMVNYALGVKKYIFKESDAQIEQARRKYRILKFAHYSLCSILIFLFISVLILFTRLFLF